MVMVCMQKTKHIVTLTKYPPFIWDSQNIIKIVSETEII